MGIQSKGFYRIHLGGHNRKSSHGTKEHFKPKPYDLPVHQEIFVVSVNHENLLFICCIWQDLSAKKIKFSKRKSSILTYSQSI